jgi:hypothetical protein
MAGFGSHLLASSSSASGLVYDHGIHAEVLQREASGGWRC